MDDSCFTLPFADYSILLNLWRSEKFVLSCILHVLLHRLGQIAKNSKIKLLKTIYKSLNKVLQYFYHSAVFQHAGKVYGFTFLVFPSELLYLISVYFNPLMFFFLPKRCITMKFPDYFPSHIANHFGRVNTQSVILFLF